MKQTIKQLARRFGVHLYTDDSLATGVDWLLDIKRIAKRSGDFPKTFFDVGANLGQTIFEMRSAFPDSRIFAFEPFPSTYRNLCTRTAHLSGVQTFPVGLGADAAVMRVPARENDERNSLLAANRSPVPGASAETVSIETLDQFCTSQNVPTIDVLKTDTEGYDLEVLKGGAKLLAEGRVRFVYSEVTFATNNVLHTPLFPLYDLLSSHDFRFLGIYETYSLHHAPEHETYCNALFVNRSWGPRAESAARHSPPA